MVRHFCDFCGREITAGAPHRTPEARVSAVVEKNGITLELDVIQSFKSGACTGDICRYCILDALAALDDRPRTTQVA